MSQDNNRHIKNPKHVLVIGQSYIISSYIYIYIYIVLITLLVQIATHGILKYCLRGLLGKLQRDTIFFLMDTLREVLSESINLDTISSLKHKMHTALAMLERDFPIALQVICTT